LRHRPWTLFLATAGFVMAVLTLARAHGRQETAPGAPQGLPLPVEGMSTPAPPPMVPPPLPGGPAPDLDLVFTSQVAGWIEPCG